MAVVEALPYGNSLKPAFINSYEQCDTLVFSSQFYSMLKPGEEGKAVLAD